MIKNILGVVAGIVVGGIVIAVVEGIGHAIFPPPEGVDLKNPEHLKNIMDQIPFTAKFAVLIAWFLGILSGGSVARLLTNRAAFAAWVVAGVLFALAVVTMMQIPHPIWMIAGSVIATIVGATLANRIVAAK